LRDVLEEHEDQNYFMSQQQTHYVMAKQVTVKSPSALIPHTTKDGEIKGRERC